MIWVKITLFLNNMLILVTSPLLLQDGCTAIILAIRSGHASIVKLILDSKVRHPTKGIHAPCKVSIIFVSWVASEFTVYIKKWIGGKWKERGRERDRSNWGIIKRHCKVHGYLDWFLGTQFDPVYHAVIEILSLYHQSLHSTFTSSSTPTVWLTAKF